VVLHDTIRVLQPPIEGLEAIDIGDVEGIVDSALEEEDSFSSEGSERREVPEDELEDSEV
jgi:hypothetical protein